MLLLLLMYAAVETSMCNFVDLVMLMMVVLYLRMLYHCWYGLECWFWCLYFCFSYKCCYWLMLLLILQCLPLLIVTDVFICIIHLAGETLLFIFCWWCAAYCWSCKYAVVAFDSFCYWYVNVYFYSLLLPVLELMLLLLLIDVAVDISMCNVVNHVMLMLLVLYFKTLYYCNVDCYFAKYMCFIHLAFETSISIVCWWCATYYWSCKYTADSRFDRFCYWYVNVYSCYLFFVGNGIHAPVTIIWCFCWYFNQYQYQ